jgi:hypothetical protein
MKRTYGVTRAASGIGATAPPPDSVLWADRMESRRPWATTRLPSWPDTDRERSSRCAVGDVRRAGVASRFPALPPRARVPVPECSEVSQPGLPSCLVEYR